MEQAQNQRDKAPYQDLKVRLTSKRRAAELLKSGSELLRSALDGQPELPEETRRDFLQQLLANFQAAVRLNVLVDGQPWDEAPDLQDEEILDLESLLDDAILETSSRRHSYPKHIRPHVVNALKAQRKVLGLYETSVQPERLQRDPDQEKIMTDLSAAAPGMAQQTVQVLKVRPAEPVLILQNRSSSCRTGPRPAEPVLVLQNRADASLPVFVSLQAIDAVQKQAQGLCEVLHMKPSSASLQIHREVLGSTCRPEAPPPAGGAARSGRPIRRAAEEAAAMGGYVPETKKPRRRAGEDVAERRFLL
uniref:NSL1 component of MIS12 kinetochore complex n=1 Tax=Fundulus heteroclitus TaxID=8078 RepID=A0A3Q2QKU6_FUNHE